MLNKILGMATVGGALANAGMLHRFLSGIAGAVMLAIVGSFMFCVLISGSFVLIYMGLVHYGLDPFVSAMIVGFLVCALSAALALFAVVRMRHLSKPPRNEGSFDVSAIADSFMTGFFDKKKR